MLKVEDVLNNYKKGGRVKKIKKIKKIKKVQPKIKRVRRQPREILKPQQPFFSYQSVFPQQTQQPISGVSQEVQKKLDDLQKEVTESKKKEDSVAMVPYKQNQQNKLVERDGSITEQQPLIVRTIPTQARLQDQDLRVSLATGSTGPEVKPAGRGQFKNLIQLLPEQKYDASGEGEGEEYIQTVQEPLTKDELKAQKEAEKAKKKVELKAEKDKLKAQKEAEKAKKEAEKAQKKDASKSQKKDINGGRKMIKNMKQMLKMDEVANKLKVVDKIQMRKAFNKLKA